MTYYLEEELGGPGGVVTSTVIVLLPQVHHGELLAVRRLATEKYVVEHNMFNCQLSICDGTKHVQLSICDGTKLSTVNM